MKIDCEAATNHSENRLVLGFSSCLSRTGLAQVTSILLPLMMVSVIQQGCLNDWQQLKQYNILRLAANMAISASCLVLKWTNAKSLIILSLVTWPSEYTLKTFRNSCSVVVIDKFRTYRTVTWKAQNEKIGLNSRHIKAWQKDTFDIISSSTSDSGWAQSTAISFPHSKTRSGINLRRALEAERWLS